MSSIIYPVTNLAAVEQLTIVSGKGVYVFDDTGNQYLEGLSGLWVFGPRLRQRRTHCRYQLST